MASSNFLQLARRMHRRHVAKSIALFWLLSGCTNRSSSESTIYDGAELRTINSPTDSPVRSQFQHILRIASTTDGAMEFDAEVHSQVEQLVSQINDPADLRELTVFLRKYDHQADHDGRCAVCERLGEVVDICITRLAGLQSDASAKELVRLLADESLHWDGAPSMWLGRNITRMGPIALPTLKAVADHPFVGERVRLYIDLIGRGEVYGP